ncbi:retrovirus-related pol polyprotein from transposon TNT 1-94 [Tanacetum coccineum]
MPIILRPLTLPISIEENSNDEVDERSSEEYLRDLELEYNKRALLENSKRFIKRRNNFSGQKANENTECYKCGKKFQKDYKAEYKKMKAKLALLEASPSGSQNLKTFQLKNKGLVAKTFDWDEEQVSDEEKVTRVKKIPHQKKKVLGGELLTESSSKKNENENLFVPASMGYDQEMVPKTKDWVERLNPDIKLPNFNTGRILVPESQAVNESLKTSNTPESSKDSKAEFLTPLPPLKILQVASPNSEELSLILYCMICKREDHRTSDHEMYIALLKRSENYKAQPYQYASSSKQILREKAKPFPPCTHCSLNDHMPDDYRNYPECEICGSYDHSTSGHNRVIQIRGGVLAESSHSTSNHNEFDHFKRGEKIQAVKAREPTKKMVENQNDVKVKQIRTDNGTKFQNHELESFCDEKGISQNFSSPYTPEQNGVAERKNRTLIEAARTMLNRSVLSKHFWTNAVRTVCYTQNRSIIIKRHDKTSYEIFKERIPDTSYFHVFGCPVFIHNHKDHLGKFDAKADDGYFLGYSPVSKALRVYNTIRQQIKETYNVTFDESMEAIRQYQVDFDVSYYIIPHGRPLTEITQENHVPEVIAPNEPEIPHTKDDEGPHDPINTKGTHEQKVQNDQMITQPNDVPSGNNTKVSESITEPLVPDVTLPHIINQASISSHPVPQDRCMAVKLTTASANECLFADFLSEIEPKKMSEVLKHPGWINAMQEELNQFYRNKVWTLVPLPYGKIAIGSKWEEGIDYDETFALVARMEAIRIFLAFATYMNFKVYQMGVKSAFLNGKLKEEVYVKQPHGFESSEFPNYVCKLDKALYGLKQELRAWYETLSTFLIQNKFARGRIDNTLFIYKSKGEVLLVQVYVDDIIFGSTSYKLCKQFEKLMTKKFKMSMMGELTYFLGLQIKQDDKGILIFQEQYTRNLLKKYEISNSSLVKKPMVPPNNLGLDLAGKSVNETSYRGMIGYEKNPQKKHLGACQILGGKLVCWSAKKQQSVAMSLAEAKYVAAAGCCASILWMKSQLNNYDIHYKMVPIFCDNTSAIAISNNLVLHSRTNHIDIRYYFIRDHLLKGDIKLYFICTEYQLADIFIKPLYEPTFTRLKAELSMLNID